MTIFLCVVAFVLGFLIPRDAFPWMKRLSVWFMLNRNNTTLARWIIAIALAGLILLVACGCAVFRGAAGIKVPGVAVTAPKDNGKPATLETNETGTTMGIPAGSAVKVTHTDAQPASDKEPAKPGTTVTEIVPSAPTEIRHTGKQVTAGTGTVDTSVALKKIDAAERRPLLFCAIGAAVAGLAFMYVRFQAIAGMCFIGAGCFFLAWRMAEISPWVGGLFLVAAVAGFAFYKRAEWDKDGDGLPDFLQRK